MPQVMHGTVTDYFSISPTSCLSSSVSVKRKFVSLCYSYAQFLTFW
ncbi:Uncharacterized protein APZ42_023817 [Daphnia magna]|uniref:Uncharacterized protein n=1 Tax=Daphnia magna TaxID=35525 RepID=A0A164U5M3_9CRUS|nr:Uncharacterized protein APZ42_023817 [Daphnia magna]